MKMFIQWGAYKGRSGWYFFEKDNWYPLFGPAIHATDQEIANAIGLQSDQIVVARMSSDMLADLSDRYDSLKWDEYNQHINLPAFIQTWKNTWSDGGRQKIYDSLKEFPPHIIDCLQWLAKSPAILLNKEKDISVPVKELKDLIVALNEFMGCDCINYVCMDADGNTNECQYLQPLAYAWSEAKTIRELLP